MPNSNVPKNLVQEVSVTRETESMRFDVLTLGETMLRLTPPELNRLNQTRDFQIHVGGSESNTAVGLARLGHSVAWISRLPHSPLGEIVDGELRRYGVNTEHVVWSESDRMGLYFLETGSLPRPSQVIYDRRESAMSRMQPSELPSHLFDTKRARLFHTTGITLAISESARATALQAAQLAKAAGLLVSFDVNYRSKLWTPADARRGCEPLFANADLIFIPERDARVLFDDCSPMSAAEILTELRSRYPQAVWVMTCGRLGSLAMSNAESATHGIFASSEVGRLGGGDSFSAGFISSWLETEGVNLARALRFGAAASAIKYSLPGDLPLFTRFEVEQLVASAGSSELLR